MSAHDRVTVEVDVAVDPAAAFDAFTRDIGVWWCSRKEIGTGRVPRRSSLRFEAGPGGRLIEEYEGGERPPYTVGRILVWQPGDRLVFEWRPGNFTEDQCTEVDVRFVPAAGGTRVVLEHRGFDALPPDHGARHGLGVSDDFTRMMEQWWTGMLADLARHVRGSG